MIFAKFIRSLKIIIYQLFDMNILENLLLNSNFGVSREA